MKKAKGKSPRAKAAGGEGTKESSRSPFRFSSAEARRESAAATVGIIGAGRLGTALARALDGAGYDLLFLSARSTGRALSAARAAGVSARALSAEHLGEIPFADVIFITTPDDAVADMAARLAAVFDERAAAGKLKGAGRGRRTGGVVLHASGALSSDVLAPLRACGFAVGSLHPLAAVSEAGPGAESLRRAFFCIEGDERAARAARRVVRKLGARSFSIRTEAKALYHAAAVMSAGHAVALFDVAASLLARCGLKGDEARRVLLPLASSAIENLERQTPSRALTGTFARADAETVRRHLDALFGAGDREALEIYKLLGRRSLTLAEEAGADARLLALIARMLMSKR